MERFMEVLKNEGVMVEAIFKILNTKTAGYLFRLIRTDWPKSRVNLNLVN